MFRMWMKLLKDNRIIKDITIENALADTRTHKIFGAIEKGCHYFDISQPIWLEYNQKMFKRFSKTRFNRDCFMEEIDFDYMEIEMIEED